MRWCTKNLKILPFEKFVGDGPVVSYVGIRADEDRVGLISSKSNIETVFPFIEAPHSSAENFANPPHSATNIQYFHSRFQM